MIKYWFLALFYGLAIPVVFPITLLAILNQYLMDKMTLMYFYRAPPHYSKELSERAYEILKKAAVVGLLFQIWVVGNPA